MIRRVLAILILFGCIAPAPAQEAIRETSHNLSVTGTGGMKGNTTQICVFCHIPHSDAQTTALWSHKNPQSQYQVPSGGSLQANVGQPDGVSLQCLGCHDGTIAVGDLVTGKIEVIGRGREGRIQEGQPGFIGTDITGHHPVSFVFDETLIQRNNEAGDISLKLPQDPSWLDAQGKVQCTSCHDPHSDAYPGIAGFWKRSTFDEVCLQCHEP